MVTTDYGTLIGNPVLEVEPTDQRGRSASEAFDRWNGKHIVSPSDNLFISRTIQLVTGSFS